MLAGGVLLKHFHNECLRHLALVTTSIAEGFGLAFLEPWISGSSVVGRNLPDITEDFSVELDHLYDRFDVPVDRVDLRELRAVMLFEGLEHLW